MISTRIGLRTTVAVILALSACDRSTSGPNTAEPLVPAATGPKQPVETPSEKSHRLLPKIVPGGSRTSLVPPLATVDEKLGFGIELVLRKPGQSKKPSLTELAEIQALGRPLPELLARNLRRYLTDPPPELDVMQGSGGTRIYRLIIDFPGRESLILLPELWERFAQQDKHRVCMALPMRTRLMILPRDDEKLLRELAPTLAKLYREAAEPICKSYIFFENGGLVAGPSFASLAGH